MNIKNIIFDYGNTIVEFNPEKIVKSFGVTGTDVSLVAGAVFDRAHWDKSDRGLITQEEFIKGALCNVPERLHAKATAICNGWITALPFINGMDSLIRKLKKDGYKLYLLSNISDYFAQNSGGIKIFKEFDGLVFSGEIKMVKPGREIFEYILTKYSLRPEESVFIDDNADNIRAAEKMGIRSLEFDGDFKKAEKFIYG